MGPIIFIKQIPHMGINIFENEFTEKTKGYKNENKKNYEKALFVFHFLKTFSKSRICCKIIPEKEYEGINYYCKGIGMVEI